jgi:hypothetical protein
MAIQVTVNAYKFLSTVSLNSEFLRVRVGTQIMRFEQMNNHEKKKKKKKKTSFLLLYTSQPLTRQYENLFKIAKIEDHF